MSFVRGPVSNLWRKEKIVTAASPNAGHLKARIAGLSYDNCKTEVMCLNRRCYGPQCHIHSRGDVKQQNMCQTFATGCLIDFVFLFHWNLKTRALHFHFKLQILMNDSNALKNTDFQSATKTHKSGIYKATYEFGDSLSMSTNNPRVCPPTMYPTATPTAAEQNVSAKKYMLLAKAFCTKILYNMLKWFFFPIFVILTKGGWYIFAKFSVYGTQMLVVALYCKWPH